MRPPASPPENGPGGAPAGAAPAGADEVSGAAGFRRRRNAAGFSLVEALVGLALLGLVLTASLAVTYRLPRDLERLAARKEANRAAESILESVRAGAVALVPGRRAWPLPGATPERQVRGWLEVATTATPDLFRVTAEVRYLSLGEPRESRFDTLAWSP